ncbi:MAG TPA: Solitary outer membrane autotransporter beta-barrel domain [Verrucomicrobiae bacterium]|nr:Solitary outer membrane autotransporter beta-barrel domain [Verrucomicrobiae bacterium]
MQSRQKRKLLFNIAVFLFSGTVFAAPPSLPPGAQQQLDDVVGQRVEATAVLGTQNIASRSGLGWKLNNADGTIYKLPWKFGLNEPTPIGDSEIKWTPVLEGGAGYGEFENHFENNVLAGNESDYDTIALSLGAGPRFYFSDSGFSVLPAFDFLFAHTENHFFAHTLAGEAVLANGQFVNWQVWTISFVPSFELRYKKTFGHWTPEFTSGYAYFHTIPISRSTDAISFRSNSMVWANKIDLDYLTDWKLRDCPIHFGGDFSRTDLYGGLRESMNTDHYYQTDGRVTFDVAGKFWKIATVGLSAGYFWSGAFNGYSVGLEGSLKF